MNVPVSKQGLIILSTLAISLIFQSSGIAKQASFQSIGDLPGELSANSASYHSEARGISSDGSTVVGRSQSSAGYQAIRWTASDGLTGFYDLSDNKNELSISCAASADGSTIVGKCQTNVGSSSDVIQGFKWDTSDGMTGLGFLTPGTFEFSYALGVSNDGSVIVGASSNPIMETPVRWTAQGGIQALDSLYSGMAYGVSGNGSIVVGYVRSTEGLKAFQWSQTDGIELIGSGQAYSASEDGSVIVGQTGSIRAFRWTSSEGMEELCTGNASDVSADGTVVVGHNNFTNQAFYWTAGGGTQDMKNMLTGYGLNLNGWTLNNAIGISADGLTITGNGINPQGYQEGWVATIPEPATLFLLGLGITILRKKS